MIYSHSGALPRHLYVWIEPNSIGNHGWIRAVWFALNSYPGRAWGCHCLLEGGAVYRNVPLHKLATRQTDVPWTANTAQTWDAYGLQFSTIEYPYLAGNKVKARVKDKREFSGNYLFTLVPIGDAFSAAPEQSKEFMFCGLDNGRITAQPTNHVLIEDQSFTTALQWPTNLHRQTDWHSAED